MLLLHKPWPNGDADQLKFPGETWVDALRFMGEGHCPRFVLAEVARARLGKPQPQFENGAGDDEKAAEQPEWLDLLGNASYQPEELELSFDDYTSSGYDHGRGSGFAAIALRARTPPLGRAQRTASVCTGWRTHARGRGDVECRMV